MLAYLCRNSRAEWVHEIQNKLARTNKKVSTHTHTGPKKNIQKEDYFFFVCCLNFLWSVAGVVSNSLAVQSNQNDLTTNQKIYSGKLRTRGKSSEKNQQAHINKIKYISNDRRSNTIQQLLWIAIHIKVCNFSRQSKKEGKKITPFDRIELNWTELKRVADHHHH